MWGCKADGVSWKTWLPHKPADLGTWLPKGLWEVDFLNYLDSLMENSRGLKNHHENGQEQCDWRRCWDRSWTLPTEKQEVLAPHLAVLCLQTRTLGSTLPINTGKSITSAWIKIKYQEDLARKLLEVCWEFLNHLWSSFVNKCLFLVDADLTLEIRIIEHRRRLWRSSALKSVTVVINFLLKAVKTNFSK